MDISTQQFQRLQARILKRKMKIEIIHKIFQTHTKKLLTDSHFGIFVLTPSIGRGLYLLKVIEKLRVLGFNPVFLTSEKMNLNKLEKMTKHEVTDVKAALKRVSGIYRKRLVSSKHAFVNKTEYEPIIYSADNKKLAKMLRTLGFLAQTKVYLFWKKQTKK